MKNWEKDGIELFRFKTNKKAYTFLAPMSGITDIVFRLLMKEMGVDIVISELISAEGLARGNEKTEHMITFDEKERPVGIQLFGANPTSMVEAARRIEQKGADFIDINLGCPVKKVVKTGAGSHWLTRPVELYHLLKAIRKAITIPLTIKIRTGWDQQSRNAEEICQIAYDAGCSWVAIHGRTRAQFYEGKADWEYIKEVYKKSPLPIIGNGDILSAKEALNKLEQNYCSAVMIGRGALKNPWIFQQFYNLSLPKGSLITLIKRHFELALEKKTKNRAFSSLKKFMSWYASGWPGVNRFREKIFATKDINTLQQLSFEFFCSHSFDRQQLDRTPFLMGGHG